MTVKELINKLLDSEDLNQEVKIRIVERNENLTVIKSVAAGISFINLWPIDPCIYLNCEKRKLHDAEDSRDYGKNC